jgi:cardiolipin synthase C
MGVPDIGDHHAGRCIGLAILALVLAACSPPRPGMVKQASAALPPATSTPGARYVNAEAARHEDQSGFLLLTRSNNALMGRISLADHAEHSSETTISTPTMQPIFAISI